MSRGRASLGLDSLRSLTLPEARAALGFEPGKPEPVRAARAAAAPSPRWEEDRPRREFWELYGKPSDYAWRTTPGDVDAEAIDLATERLPYGLAMQVRAVMSGDVSGVGNRDAYAIRAMVARCKVQVQRELARPAGRKSRASMALPWRVDGECSPVVTRYPDGTVTVDGDVWDEDDEGSADRFLRLPR